MKKRELQAMIDRLEGEKDSLRNTLNQRIHISNRNYLAGMDLAHHVALGTDITDLSALAVLAQLRERYTASAYQITADETTAS